MDRYIAIVDYGAGNLFSMKNALDYIGARSIITSEPEALERSAAVLLPGVGAFPDAMNKLRAARSYRRVVRLCAAQAVSGYLSGHAGFVRTRHGVF